MQIKIKALADIEFLSAKVDKKHNIIHVQAKNLLDSTGKDCGSDGCTGKYIAHGFVETVYEDLNIDGYRVFIHLTTRRAFCPKCNNVVNSKPACLTRDFVPDENEESWSGNHRTTNRFLDWIEYLVFKYGVDVTSEMTGVKPRRLYYIRQAYRDRNTDMHMGERSLVIAKSRHNNKNFYLVIDTMYDSELLDYFNSPKLALNYVLVLKRNNPAIRKVTVPADFKYVDVLARVFGQDNVQYDFRSLQSMITTGCFNAYREQRNSDDESSIETEEHLFRTPRTQLTHDEQIQLDNLLRTSPVFHDYYYLQRDYWYSLDEKVVLKARIKNADVIDENMKDKNRISNRDKDKSIDDITYELGCNLDLNERKEYILYKMNKSCKKYEESQYDETVEVDVDQEDAYE